ncbi:hypothetical protein HMPREF9374_0857 [Desmospora sp. 8437]|nr:hypothetical protein HMPREF9374_0857 [Desmospora sp. 8437]
MGLKGQIEVSVSGLFPRQVPVFRRGLVRRDRFITLFFLLNNKQRVE